MRRVLSYRRFGTVLLMMLLMVTVSTLDARPDRRRPGREPRDSDRLEQQKIGLTAQQAAAQARARYGGKVLRVTPQNHGYRVRLLLDSGRVITVTIR